MYANDLVILCPCSAGLQQLLRICSQYGIDDIKCNVKKSNIMIVRSRKDEQLVFPEFFLSDIALKVCNEAKYLGHYITDDLSDDKDIYRQCRKLYAQANTLARKFSMCSVPGKTSLFKAFFTPLYTAHLWRCYKRGSMLRITVAYNDSMRLLV